MEQLSFISVAERCTSETMHRSQLICSGVERAWGLMTLQGPIQTQTLTHAGKDIMLFCSSLKQLITHHSFVTLAAGQRQKR